MRITFLSLVVFLVTFTALPGVLLAETKTGKDAILVKLDHFTDDLHAATMALKLAHGLQKNGHEVTLFVNLEGVRLVDKNQPNDLAWGTGKSIGSIYQKFTKAGGKTLVCPHCAKATGLSAETLRSGARIAKEGELLTAIAAADKILTY